MKRSATLKLVMVLAVALIGGCSAFTTESAQPVLIVNPPVLNFSSVAQSATIRVEIRSNVNQRILVDTMYFSSPGLTLNSRTTNRNTSFALDSMGVYVVNVHFNQDTYRNAPDPRLIISTDIPGIPTLEIAILVPVSRPETQLSGVAGVASRYFNTPVKFSGNGTLILYNSQVFDNVTREYFYDVFTMNLLGENRTRITTTTNGNSHGVDISSGGTRILYYTDRPNGSRNMYIWNDGAPADTITKDNFINTPVAFSQNGNRILFNSNRAGNMDAYYYEISTKRIVRLTENNYPEEAVAWSSDGTRVLIKATISNQTEITLSTLIGQPLRLTNNTAMDVPVAFSPDGNRILFYSDRNFRREVYTMAINGSDILQLTNNQQYDFPSRYFPDGNKILYASVNYDNSQNLYSIDTRGGQQSVSKLTSSSFQLFPADISPDGRLLLYYSPRAVGRAGTDIFVTRIETITGV